MTLAERIAREVARAAAYRSCFDHLDDEFVEELLDDWAAIVDRHIREATGVR